MVERWRGDFESIEVNLSLFLSVVSARCRSFLFHFSSEIERRCGFWVRDKILCDPMRWSSGCVTETGTEVSLKGFINKQIIQ